MYVLNYNYNLLYQKKFPSFLKSDLTFSADLWIPWPAATPKKTKKSKNCFIP